MTRRFRRWGASEQTLDDELQSYLQHDIDSKIQSGVPLEEARRSALIELRGIDQVKEHVRESRTGAWLESVMQDTRYAFRSMAGNRAFTALAILSLALGIGANASIYSFLELILVRSLPVRDSGSLVILNWQNRSLLGDSVAQRWEGSSYGNQSTGYITPIFPFPAFELLQQQNSTFSVLFAHRNISRNLTVTFAGQAESIDVVYVSGNFFQGLGVVPAAGRLIQPDDDRAGALPVAVVSSAFSRQYAGKIGSDGAILLNNVPFTVVGVVSPEFFGVNPALDPDIFVPMHNDLLLEGRSADDYGDQHFYWIEMMGRLRPEITLSEAEQAITPIFQRWVDSTASNDAERANLPRIVLESGARGVGVLRWEYSFALLILMTLAGLILAIACANIANLLLARAAARRHEIALRLSLGANRRRVVRQLLTENIALASLGAIVGVLLARWGIRFLTALLDNGLSGFTFRADLNLHVLGVTVVLSVLTGLLFGLAPALESTRVDLMPALKRIRTGRSPARLGIGLSQALTAFQVAMSLLLLIAAGLFTRTLASLQSVELGFNDENVLMFEVDPRKAGYSDVRVFHENLRQRLAEVSGIRAVSFSGIPLIDAGQIRLGGVWAKDSISEAPSGGTPVLPIGPRFFTTMEIPLLLGREFDERDGPDSTRAVIVSERFAKANFGDENPLGKRVLFPKTDGADEFEIIGVSKDARYGLVTDDLLPVVFVPHSQLAGLAGLSPTYVVRTAGNPSTYMPSVREIIRGVDSRVPVGDLRTLAAHIDRTRHQEILFARLGSAFAVIALMIACVGLYGTVAYNVSRRTSEIGVRLALGAESGHVIWIVVREVVLLSLAGLAIGLPLAFGASRYVESFLFGITPNDPGAFAGGMGILLAAAAVAAFVPAFRASRIDPMIAVRHE